MAEEPEENEEDSDVKELREMGATEEEIQKYQDHMSSGSKKETEKQVLKIKYENIVVYRWLCKHPLIWEHGNDGDGVRLLLGLNYTRINQLFDHLGLLKDSVFRRDLFFRLMQIEQGAKASFDKRIQQFRKQQK